MLKMMMKSMSWKKGLENKEVTSKDDCVQLAKHTNTTRITMFMIITSPNMGFHIMTHFLNHPQNSLQTTFQTLFSTRFFRFPPNCQSDNHFQERVDISLTYLLDFSISSPDSHRILTNYENSTLHRIFPHLLRDLLTHW